jgi:NADPH2:quinone reductase
MKLTLQPGQRVTVSELSETPLEAIESRLTLAPQAAPEALGDREVLIAVESAQVGWVDLLMTSGQYQHAPPLPYTPGLEYAGVVAQTGARVSAVRPGDRVLVDGLVSGPRSVGDYQQWGGFASWAVAPEQAVLPIPGALTFDEACNLLGNYETAYHCLIARGRLQAGETVLINGASGATGLAAVHVARLVGATVIASGRSASKLAIVKAQGAHHVIDCSDPTGAAGVRRFRDDVKALTGGNGVDLVYDGVGGEVSQESLRAIRFGGRFLVVGWASTPFVANGKGLRGAPNANQLPTNIIMMKGVDVLGCPTVLSTLHDPSLRAPRREAVLAWASRGEIAPLVSQAYPLSSFREAMRAKWHGQHVGGVVLNPPR